MKIFRTEHKNYQCNVKITINYPKNDSWVLLPSVISECVKVSFFIS